MNRAGHIAAALQRAGGTQFVRFCCVGAANFLVDFCAYLALAAIMSIYPARALSWALACLFSYAVNRSWTFRAGTSGVLPVLRFFAVNLCSLGLGLLLLYAFTSLGCGKAPAFLLTIPFTLAANFLGYKLWVFAGR